MFVNSIRFALLGSLLTMIACTREISERSQVTFDLSSYQKSDLGSQSVTKEIDFVAINVSGGGMPRIVCRFDERNGTYSWVGPCRGSTDNPLQVTIDNVPSGSDRLVQVLVIVDEFDSSTNRESERFNYGELKTALKGGDNLLSITTTAAPAVTNMDGGAEGRYLFSDGTGYTGPVALEFRPPSGSSPMEIFQFEMFSGWFNIFLMDNVPLQYKMLNNGQYLFNGPVTQTASTFNPGNSAVVRFVGPPTYSSYENRLGRMHSIGFWINGAPDTSKTACRDNTSKNSNYDYTDVGMSSYLNWPASFSISGGTSCGLSDPLVSSATIRIGGDLVVQTEGGGDGYLVRGPYQKYKMTNGQYGFVQGTVSGTQLSVAWKYLPGVTASSQFAGSTVFYSSSFDSEAGRDLERTEGFDCSQLPGMGFTSFSVSGTSETATISGVSSNLTDGGFVVVCPRKSDGTHFRSVVGGFITRAPATQLAVTGPGMTYPYLNQNACTPIAIQALDANGNPGDLGLGNGNLDPVTVSFSYTGYGQFYEDPSCLSATQTLSMWDSMTPSYFKATVTGGFMGVSVATMPGESLTLTPGYWTSSVTVAQQEAGWMILGPEKLYTSTMCEEYSVALVDANAVPTVSGTSDYTVSLSSNQAGSTIYGGGACMSGAGNPMDVTMGNTNARFGFKPGPTAMSNSALTTTHLPSLLSNDVLNLSILAPPPAEYMYVNHSFSSSCDPIQISTYAMSQPGKPSIPAYPTSAITYSFMSAVLTFHANSTDCGGNVNPLNSITQSTTETNKNVYVRCWSSGSASFTVDAPGDDFDGIVNITCP